MTREMTTMSLKLIFVTRLFDKVNFTVIICKNFYIRLEVTTVVNFSIFPTIVPSYGRNITCVRTAISYIGLTDASKGYQCVKGMSCLSTIRTVE